MSTLILRSGEPRPWFAQYLVKSYPKSVSYNPIKITFQCELQPNGKFKRVLSYKGTLGTAPPKTPFVMFGITVMSKQGCAGANRARTAGDTKANPDMAQHLMYVLWDTRTNVLTVDQHPFVYHQNSLTDFTPYPLASRLKKELPAWMESQGHTVTINKGSNATAVAALVQKVKKWVGEQLVSNNPTPMIWYLLYVLWDFDTLFKNPDATAAERVALMKKAPALEAQLMQFQTRFESFYVKKAQTKARCEASAPQLLYHPETKRCVLPDGKVGKFLQRIKPAPQRVPASAAATAPAAQLNFIDRSLMSAKSNDKTFLDSMYDSIAIVDYLAPKYPHVAISNERIRWRVENKVGVLQFTPGFDAFWTKSLADPSVKQIVTLMGLETDIYKVGHANSLIYTKATNELEVFEPIGLDIDGTFGNKEMYEALGDAMKEKFGLVKLLTPTDYCPNKMTVFQALEGGESNMWDTEGYCAVWTIWYTEMRLSNSTLSTKSCVELAMRRLLDMGSLRAFIWNYDRWVHRDWDAMQDRKKLNDTKNKKPQLPRQRRG